MRRARGWTVSSVGAGILAAAVLAVGCDRESGAPAAQQGRAAASAALPPGVRPTPAPPARYAIGRRATAAEIATWNIDVGPDGEDLPAGRGTYSRGATVYAQKCAACHGARGEGMGQGLAAFPRLIGREPREGFPFGLDPKHAKTVGNYWPHATTLFDYVRRAMPLTAPGSLSADETYGVVAFLLAENEILGKEVVVDARSLRRVVMPARERFVPDDRQGGPQFR